MYFIQAFFSAQNSFSSFFAASTYGGKSVLELGAGSGLISIYCFQHGARVTASDISQQAIDNTKENAAINHANLNIVRSDLFETIDAGDFDVIVVNPPYYPKRAKTESDFAWYCGEHFEYFQKLFSSLAAAASSAKVFMVLSEDCDLFTIRELAAKSSLTLDILKQKKIMGEDNYIFLIGETSPVRPAKNHGHHPEVADS